MPNFKTLEPANNPIFQVAWESTLKCNLSCSYCGDGHDNSTQHPSLDDSLKTVDFIYSYLDIIMSKKPEHLKIANLNIQGGESIFHPNIIEILDYVNLKKKDYNWTLNVSLITNGIAGTRTWREIISRVDYVTMSYHPEILAKQELFFRVNCNELQQNNKNFQVNVMMHPKYWNKSLSIIDFAKRKKMNVFPRQIDHHWFDQRFNYTAEQVEYLTGNKPVTLQKKIKALFSNGFNLDAAGRSCCGGNTLCTNSCNKITYVEGNNFKGWHCSIAQHFLYIKQLTGEVFTNKDCKMNFDGKVGPIGNLKNTKIILEKLKNQSASIICKKSKCWCGLCAPKAETKELFDSINRKYAKVEDFPE